MNLSKAHQLFQLSMLGEKADSTRTWYSQRINRLIREVGDMPIRDVTVWTLREWRAALVSQDARWEEHPHRPAQSGGLSAHTLHGHVRAVKRFFRWLVEEGLLDENPAERIAEPTLPDLPPAAIRASDVRRMVDAAESIRDRALVLFLFDTGCRVSGAVGLRWGQIDFRLRRAEVTEKSRKSRFVFLSQTTVKVLQELRRESLGGRSARVFIFETGDGVRQCLSRLAERAGVEGPSNPHAFRHGWAIEALMNGADLATVSRVLGHKSVQVTANFYARFAIAWLAEQHQKYSPVPRL